jgi:hypothetical protein
MKANVNFEFASEEIEKFATGVLTRALVGAIGSVGPNEMQVLLGGLQAGMGLVLSHAQAVAQGRPPPPPPPWARGPGGPHGAAPAIPHDAPQQGNVRPIRGESAVTEHCFRIEGTRQLEEGWGCCGCSTYNGAQRTHCRHCGHARCGAVITPAPAAGTPPQVADGMTHVPGLGLVPTEAIAIVREMQDAALGGAPATTDPPREPA